MRSARHDILTWVEQGRLDPGALPAALKLAGVTPDVARWRSFLDQLLLWLGALLTAAAVIFFFAYNWQAMGRFTKFGMAQALLAAAVYGSWKFGLDRLAGKVALLVAALLTGALLALVGQTYQTGADTFELFTGWALAITAWVLIGCFSALWLCWIGLINIAIVLYYQTFGGLFGLLFGPERLLWHLFVFNTGVLVVWECAARRGVRWLRERWSPRGLAVVSGGLITTLALWAILDVRQIGPTALLVYVGWLAVAYAVYRHWIRDLFVLAGGVLSAIILVTTFLSKHLLTGGDAGAFLFIGLVVLGLAALGGLWLRTIAREEQS